MTDFLTRLAQRALGIAPTVQPRHAYHYAPATEVMMPPPLDSLTVTQPATAPDSFASQVISETSAHSESLLVSSTDQRLAEFPHPSVPVSDREANPEINYPALIHPTAPTSSASPRLPQPTSETLSAPASSPVLASVDASTSSVKHAPFPPQQNLEHHTVSPANQTVESAQFKPPASLEHPPSFFVEHPLPPSLHTNLLQAEQPQARALLASPVVTTTVTLPLVNVQPINLPSSVTPNGGTRPELTVNQTAPSRLPSPMTPSSHHSEPTIEVRIGRIEVREVQPTSSKRRSQSTPTTPALSLSDYLNQRDGGKL